MANGQEFGRVYRVKLRYFLAFLFVASLGTSSCKSTGKNSEVMINTSTQKTQRISGPGTQTSTAAQLGDPTLSGGREHEGE